MSLCGLWLGEIAPNMSEVNSAVSNSNNDTHRTSNSSTSAAATNTPPPPPTMMMSNSTTDSCSLIQPPSSVPTQLPSSSSSSNNISAAVQQQILLQHWTQQFQQQQQEHQAPSLLPQLIPSIMSQPQPEQQQQHSYHPASTTTTNQNNIATPQNTTPIPIVSSIAPLTHSQQPPPPSIPPPSHYHQPPPPSATMMTMMNNNNHNNNKEPSSLSSSTYHNPPPVTNAPAASTTSTNNLYPTPSQQQLQQQQQQHTNNALLSQQWAAFLQHQQQQQQKNPSPQPPPQQQPLIGNLVMMGQPSSTVPMNSGTDGHVAQQQQQPMSISVQQQQLILQQLLANVMVAQQQQGQQQQPVVSNPVTGVSQQQFIMNPFQQGMNYPASNNSSNVSSSITPFSANGTTAVAVAAGSPPAMLSPPAPTMHTFTAQPQLLPQSNASTTIPSNNTVNNSDNKKSTNVDEIGTHTFNEGWKTMWDDEDDVDVDILDNPRTTSHFQPQQQIVAAAPTPSVAANDGADDEDWAPTPLSEIQAKQLKRQFVPSDTATESNKRHHAMSSGGGNSTTNKNNSQGSPVPISSCAVTSTGSAAANMMLPPPQPPTSHSQPSVLQQLQMSYLQQQSNLYQPSPQQHPVPVVSNNNNIGTAHSQSAPNHQPTVPPFPNTNNNNTSNSSSVLQPQLFGHKISARLMSSQPQRQSPPPQHDKSALKLPSTVMSPSVLASILPVGTRDRATSGGSVDTTTSKTNKRSEPTGMNAGSSNPQNTIQSPSVTPIISNINNNKSKYVTGGGRGKPGSSASPRLELPQDYLERIITLRGFIVKPGSRNDRARQSIRIKAEQSGYDTTPSPLQLASFGTELVKAVHESDIRKLHRLLSAGLSPNPCNQFSDSIVDLVCKRSNTEIFRCLLDHGCDLRVCDGFGRTPLHHCCWAFEFNPDIVTLILQSDPQQLFMEDKRGQTPLEYVRPDQAADWIRFLEANANTFFPTGGSLPTIVSLKQIRIHGHIADPPNALSVQLATAISSGSVTPEDLEQMDPVLRARFS